MNCHYTYKGKIFQSEASLNDYLIHTETLKSKLGDLVYLLSEVLSRYVKNLKEAEAIYRDVKDKGILIDTVKKEELEPDELDDVGSLKYPYISVTDFIHTLPSRYTNLVFPIFDSENYWSHKFDDYKNGIFNAYEVLFISDLIEQNSDGSIKKVTDQTTLNAIRERMEGVLKDGLRKGGLWLLQAICGNMIHNMASLFYRQRIRENGPFLYQTSIPEVINWFNNNIDPQYKKYINKDIIKSSVETFFNLDKEIRNKWGEDAYIRTELAIVGDIDMNLEGGQVTKIIGKIDLLVIGKDGSIGIIDYKCSPKDYTELNVDNNPFEYNSAKILTFKYLLATYRRILQSMNINPNKMELYVAPLKFEGFKMENELVSFDRISSLNKTPGNTILQKLSNSDIGDERTNIESNLARLFPKNRYIPAIDDIDNIIEDVQNTMKRQLPVPEKDTTEKGILELIKNNGGIRKNSSTGEWEYRPRKNSDIGYRHYDGTLSEQDAMVKLKEDLMKNAEYNENYNIETASSLRKQYLNYYHNEGDNPLDNILTLGSKKSTTKKNASYLRSRLKKYSDKSIWQPLEEESLNPILDLFGILLFRNKASGLIDIVKISNLYDPTQPVKLRKGKYILGLFLKDDLAHSSADSLTMESTAGNIELIETMHVINRLHGIFRDDNSGIGNIKLLCPRMQTGLEAPNELLLYNYNRLCLLDLDFKNNHFITPSNPNGSIKMATYIDILKLDAKEIIRGFGSGEGFDVLKKEIKNSLRNIDFTDKSDSKIRDELLVLDKKLVQSYPHITLNIKEGQIESPEAILHKDLLYAITELNGIKMVQLLQGFKSFSISTKGISGTSIDNPGTLQSHILNLATDQVTRAYLNVRDSVILFDIELRKRLLKLKDSKNFGWIQQNITSNQVSNLYINMYDKNSKDFKFVNPWLNNCPLETEEREFLKYALIKINSTRKDNINLAEMLKDPDKMGDLIKKDDSLLLVPLTKGDFASEVATRGGIINYVEEKFKYIKAIWDPEIRRELKNKFEEKITGLITGDQRKSIEEGELWEAINSMHHLDLPENLEDRRNKIQLVGGIDYFEHNLETLLLKQHSNYVMSEELNKVFPTLLTLAIHLNLQGAVLNDRFDDDLKYLFDYIRVKVHNQSYEKGDRIIFKELTNDMMQIASKLALAFNPKLMYLFIDGIWKDIMLFTKDYKGSLGGSFTKENLVSAWKFAMSDLGHFGDDMSLQEFLNIQYGMNDMDMNVFIDRIKTDNTGFFTHFWDTGFRFASRPDYYNRMTIFAAQMKADGCFDAHIKKDGKWVYDWIKDTRFDEFAKAKGDPKKAQNLKKFNELRSMYITIARLLEAEEVKNEDGTLFTLNISKPLPLPKAYSNKQSEAMKALADRIYGYYAHEKKSMFNSTWMGSMLMQMNTFWSAKKNQYALERSYTQEGYFVDYEEDGLKWYWKIDSDGNLIPTTEVTAVPIKVWKGRPLEGILVTLFEVSKALIGKADGVDKLGIAGAKEFLSGLEPDVRKLYMANLAQLLADLFGILFLGGLIGGSLTNFQKSFEKKHDNKYFGNALTNNSISLLVSMYNQSTEDFHWFNSLTRILGRGPNWTPFSWSSVSNVCENYKKVFTGDLDLFDAIVKTSTAGRVTKPMWDYVKLNTLGRKVGQTENNS